LTSEEQVDALEWFLADTDDADEEHSFEINVGSASRKKWVTWTVRPLDADHIRRIRKQAQQGNRAARRLGTADFDETRANVEMVVAATVVPDVRAAAKQKGLVNPGDWLKMKFKHKPGLLTQIAGEVMAISGFDDEDLRDVDAAQGL
jgi:hypothetical protein